MYIKQQLQVEHRPEHEERQLGRDRCSVGEARGHEGIGLAAQAHDDGHQHHGRGWPRPGSPSKRLNVSGVGPQTFTAAARHAPRIRKTVMSTKSCRAVSVMLPTAATAAAISPARVLRRTEPVTPRSGVLATCRRLRGRERRQQAVAVLAVLTRTTERASRRRRGSRGRRAADHLDADPVRPEGDGGAGDHDQVDDRPGQHVGDAAAQRQPLAEQRRMTGTMPHSHMGKIRPSTPPMATATSGCVGMSLVIACCGTISSRMPAMMAQHDERHGLPDDARRTASDELDDVLFTYCPCRLG